MALDPPWPLRSDIIYGICTGFPRAAERADASAKARLMLRILARWGLLCDDLERPDILESPYIVLCIGLK
jgi:hypothetical protein